MVKFSHCHLLWVSELYTYISPYTLYYEYVTLPHYVRDLLPLTIIIKSIIGNLVIYSEKLVFLSSSTVYEDNNCVMVV